MTSVRAGTSPEPTPAMGSSSRMTLGFLAMSIAISTLRFSPWASPAAAASARCAKPTSSSAASARRGRRIRAPRSAEDGCRAAERAPGRRAARSRARRASGTGSMSGTCGRARRRHAGASARPSRRARRAGRRPSVGLAMPEMTLKSVVLPAPFGPITPTSSPGAPRSDTSWRMRAPPMRSPMRSSGEHRVVGHGLWSVRFGAVGCRG